MDSFAPVRQSVAVRVTVSVLAIFVVSLWSLSYYANSVLRSDMVRLLGQQQFSDVSIIAAQIDQELTHRLKALETVAGLSGPAMQEGPAAVQALLLQLPILQTLFNGGLVGVKPDGTAIAEVAQSVGRIGVNYADIDIVAAALKQDKSSIGQPVVGKKLMAPVFGMAVPIHGDQGKVIGALSGVTNLGQPNFLDQVTQGLHGKTGGYELVSRPHRLIVAATDRTRVMEALPATGVNALVDRFTSGYQGSAVGVDPYNREVLVSAKNIPAADWLLAAALPTAEAFAPIHSMQRRMLTATIVLTLLAGGLTWWILRRQLAPMRAAATALAAMSDAGHITQPLPIARNDEIGQLIAGFNRLLTTSAQREEALKRNESKLAAILENVDASIYLKDAQGRYLFANRRLREFFGSPTAEVAGLDDTSFFDPQTVAQLQRNDQIVLTERRTLKTDETIRRAHDGRTFTTMSVKIPLFNEAGEIYALCGISTDITERKRSEDERRIAAIAFECQEGMAVMDANANILRVNHSFTQITGYSQHEAQGMTTAMLSSDRYPVSFHEGLWAEAKRDGLWQGEFWCRRKDGKDFFARVTVTAVRDETNQVANYVGNLTDITSHQLHEQQRLANEAAHRDALVLEVHHRIKNNLQGVIGLLRQSALQHPLTAEPIKEAISQVQGISVIHGLRGRADPSSVQLCELTIAIAAEVSALWQTPVCVDLPNPWAACTVAEQEAVPMALVLTELVVNAVKHGGKAHGDASITMRRGHDSDHVLMTIRNTGSLPTAAEREAPSHAGLGLVRSLLPRSGITLTQKQVAHQVVTELWIRPPVICMKKDHSL